ncbi:MAG: tellurium resistance protein TerC [Pseudomonadota bacterium]
MADLFTLENLFTLAMLVLLQAVLGFDNLLYISLESKRVAPDKQQFVRRMGIALAVLFRLVLLFVVVGLINAFSQPLFGINLGALNDEGIHSLIHSEFNFRAVVSLFGGAFIIYTATKEIFHLLAIDHLDEVEGKSVRPVAMTIFWIVLMNLVFSFDSLLSAVALTDVLPVMALAIIIGGLMMILLADEVSNFIAKNRMYEVIGLFILFIVGILLVSEGGHLAHLHLFGFEVTAMSKTTFYFVIFVMVAANAIQTRYRKKLELQRAREHSGYAPAH